MGTKRDPSQFDCYQNADPDEPLFVLLARDPLAPILVRLWADLRQQAAGNPSKVNEARYCAAAMEQWRILHRRTAIKETFDNEHDADIRGQELAEQRITLVVHRYPSDDGKIILEYVPKQPAPGADKGSGRP